jgi:MFS family permease
MAGAAAGVASLVALAVVREQPRSPSAHTRHPGLLSGLRMVLRNPRWRAIMLAILMYQTTYIVGWVLLPLQVAGRLDSSTDAAAAVGWVVAANAVGIAVGATALGWLGGRVGTTAIAIGALLAMAALSVPQSWLSEPASLAVVRLALGVCAGGVLLSLRATLGTERTGESAPARQQLGALYGLAQSSSAAGTVVGSSLAATWSLPNVHIMSAAIVIVAAIWCWRFPASS